MTRKVKKTIINPITAFKIPSEFINDPSIESKNQENLKHKPISDWEKEFKSKKAILFASRNDGTSYFCIPFTHASKTYAGMAPNLVQAYFDLAFEHIQWTERYKDTLAHTAEIKFDPIRMVNEHVFYRFIQYRLSGIVFLHLAVEAFLNQLIPDNHIFSKVEKSRNDTSIDTTVRYTKKQAERWLPFKTKLDDLLFTIPGINIDKSKFRPIRDKIIDLALIRDEIVHLKSKENATKNYYEKIFDFITTRDLLNYVDTVKSFINLCIPNYLIVEDVEWNRNTYTINITEPRFINFALLLEVVSRRFELVVVRISKTPDFANYKEGYDTFIGLIKVLEETNHIIDYHVEETDNEFIIEFYKSPEQIK